MAKKPTNFTFNNGGTAADFADAFVYMDLFSDAGLFLWGQNNVGQLGDNSRTNRSSPVQTVSSGTNWKLVAGGSDHTAAIKTDGTLWLWGRNGYGQLGDNTTANKSSPVQTVSGGTNWKLVEAAAYHTAAIKTDGTLWLWGRNVYGQLGDNTDANKSSPVQTVSSGTNWKQVAGGQEHIAAIKTDGTLWLWGNNGYAPILIGGQLGDNTDVNKSSPVQTISGGTNWKQVACGAYHTAAIKTDGTLWLWGNNYIDYELIYGPGSGFLNTGGQLGDNTTTAKSSPVQTVSGGTNWKQVAGGRFHTAAIKTDGTLWTWGANTSLLLGGSGQLGDNSATDKSSPVQTVSGGTNWKQVAGGADFTAAIKTDGTLWLWGNNIYGGLGDNTADQKSSPVQTVSGGTNWKLVAGGSVHTAALKTI